MPHLKKKKKITAQRGAILTMRWETSSAWSFKRFYQVLYHCKYVSPPFSPFHSASIPSLQGISAHSLYSGSETLRGRRNRKTDHKPLQPIPESFVTQQCQENSWWGLKLYPCCGYLVGMCLNGAGASGTLKTALSIPEGTTSVQLGKDFFMLLLFGGWKVLKTLGKCRHAIIRANIINSICWTLCNHQALCQPLYTHYLSILTWSYICLAGRERLKLIRQVASGHVAGGWHILALYPRRASSKSIFFSLRHAASPGVKKAGRWHLHLGQWLT